MQVLAEFTTRSFSRTWFRKYSKPARLLASHFLSKFTSWYRQDSYHLTFGGRKGMLWCSSEGNAWMSLFRKFSKSEYLLYSWILGLLPPDRSVGASTSSTCHTENLFVWLLFTIVQSPTIICLNWRVCWKCACTGDSSLRCSLSTREIGSGGRKLIFCDIRYTSLCVNVWCSTHLCNFWNCC